MLLTDILWTTLDFFIDPRFHNDIRTKMGRGTFSIQLDVWVMASPSFIKNAYVAIASFLNYNLLTEKIADYVWSVFPPAKRATTARGSSAAASSSGAAASGSSAAASSSGAAASGGSAAASNGGGAQAVSSIPTLTPGVLADKRQKIARRNMDPTQRQTFDYIAARANAVVDTVYMSHYDSYIAQKDDPINHIEKGDFVQPLVSKTNNADLYLFAKQTNEPNTMPITYEVSFLNIIKFMFRSYAKK